MKNSLIISVTLLLFCLHSHAQSLEMSTTARSDNEPKISASNTTSYDLIVDDGTGADESNALVTYVQINADSGNQADYFTGETTSLFRVQAGPIYTGSLTFYFKLTHNGTDKKVVIGSKDSSETDYNVVSVGSDVTTSYDSYSYTVTFSEICAKIDCTNLVNDSTEINHLFYAYLAPTTVSLDDFDPTTDDNKNGIYFDIYFTTNFDSTSAITIDPIQPGDESLYITYTSSDTAIANFYDVIVVENGTSGSPFQSGGGTILKDGYPTATSSRIQVSNLVNDQSYSLGVMFRNKYLMGTKLSGTDSETPQLIPVFLEKSACYFISAGFKEDHYVLTTLRDFRDGVLMASSLGRSFVDLYYGSAPKYALVIYKNATLSFLMRGVGYISYFIIKYFYSIISLLFIVLLGMSYRKKWVSFGAK